LPEEAKNLQKIVIVDYGMANLRSVQKAFEKVGYAAQISGEPDQVGGCDKLVLPGVGAFRDAIARLHEAGLAEPILDHVRAGKPFFGICLGLQLLFNRSYEDGQFTGLDLFPGDVVRFENVPGLKVPHMGWNQLRVRRPAPQLESFPQGGSVYFVHSYFARPRDAHLVAAEADYPTPFTAAIWHENVFATQFHPEKSQALGLEMLRRFAGLR
jgi:glutamine amidotransferase